MSDESLFLPPRRTGLILHIGLSLLLAAGITASLISAFEQPGGTSFVLFLLLSLLLIPPLIFIIYRGYALLQASYRLERDGLRLRWGLRWEDIPLMDIEWVRPASDLGFNLPMPPISTPGAILGTRRISELGQIEFLASDRQSLLLVATRHRIFAISPAETKRFTRNFQRATEMGSLTPFEPLSAIPAAFFQRIWADRVARYLILAAVAAALVLFMLAGLAVPALDSVSLGYDMNSQPLEPAASQRLFLLPTLGTMALFGDLILGFFFYRRLEQRLVAYLLWAGSIAASLLLIAAVVIIISR